MRRWGLQRIALVASLMVPAALPGHAQDVSRTDHVLPLQATVLDLLPTVEDMTREGVELSAEAQEVLQRSGDIEVRSSGDEFILSVASDVLFAFDSDNLSQQARRSLTDVAEVIIRAAEGQVLVVGHTDSKGSDDYNVDLSRRRAEAVAAFLMEHGVAADRVGVEGRGEGEPVAKNEIDGVDNPAGRAQNRRVEFVVPTSMLSEQ